MTHTTIVGNWKMSLGLRASRDLARAVAERSHDLRNTSVWLAPSFVSLPAVLEVCQGSQIQVGGQNVHWDERGAFTGEISPAILKEVGCTFSLVGHSERRIDFGETATLCAKRALGAVEAGLRAIFCIGETKMERTAGRTAEVLREQLEPLLTEIPASHIPLVTIAYEPVWAIGSGLSANSKEIEETHALIDSLCREFLDGSTLSILYGGSVSPENIAVIIQSPLVAGALVGSASLSAEKFIRMIDVSEE